LLWQLGRRPLLRGQGLLTVLVLLLVCRLVLQLTLLLGLLLWVAQLMWLLVQLLHGSTCSAALPWQLHPIGCRLLSLLPCLLHC
jgi:hypothetical protein